MAENGILDYQGMNQAIYRGATSNIVVDTQSMSIEIGAGNSSHTSNLHIECDHDANVASIQLNSNVVTEFSRSKKLIKYPRVAMTSDNQPTGYVASASSNWPGASSDPWQAFDNIWDPDGSGTNSWESHSSSFASGTTYVGPRSSTGLNTFDSNNGEYLNIKLPEKIVLQRYEHTTRANRWWEGPYSGFLYGSNDGFTTYEKIHTFSAINLTSRASYVHTVNTTTAYNEYRFHITQTQASVYVSICLFDLFGTPEYDPEARGTDVTVKSYPNVPNTDWLEVYYDAKDLTNISGTIADLSGKSVTGSLNGDVSIDTLNDVKSFSFDGSGDYISGTLTNTGDFDFTVSTWVFETNGTTNNSVWCIGNPGSANPSPAVALGINNAGSLDFFVFGGIEIRFSDFRDTFGINKWHHIVCTRAGTTIKYFINGIDQGRPIANSIPLSIAANSVFTIGVRAGSQLGNNPMHGKIANFRLFNRALTSDEIYQLYAYQKEDFGHSTNNMTLKAGRLGIGTSEPRGALDVRGDAYYGCPVFFTAYAGGGSGVTVTGSSSGTIIVFNNTTVNKGGAYDTSNGRCTFPISGYYEVFFRGGTASTAAFHAKIYGNGNAPGSGGWPNNVMRLYDDSGGTYRNGGTIQFFYYFTAGEYIEVRLTNSSVFNADNYNSFSVKYLSN